MGWYNSRMNNKEAIGRQNVERDDGKMLKDQVIDKIKHVSADEVDDIVQWMCDNPSSEWPAVIYEIGKMSDFPAKSVFWNSIDKIYEACSDIVADSDGQVDIE